MILLSITILIYISSLEFLWVSIMIFSSGYQPIYCAFPPYCALLCHNYSRLFYYTFNISSLIFRLIFYPSVILRDVMWLLRHSIKTRSYNVNHVTKILIRPENCQLICVMSRDSDANGLKWVGLNGIWDLGWVGFSQSH